jgi:hypothetical protein
VRYNCSLACTYMQITDERLFYGMYICRTHSFKPASCAMFNLWVLSIILFSVCLLHSFAWAQELIFPRFSAKPKKFCMHEKFGFNKFSLKRVLLTLGIVDGSLSLHVHVVHIMELHITDFLNGCLTLFIIHDMTFFCCTVSEISYIWPYFTQRM